MAVEPAFAGRGFGGRVLVGLEKRAQAQGATRVVLNARKPAIPFYLKHGYTIVGPADTLFGTIEHVRMEKASCDRALAAFEPIHLVKSH